MRNFDAWRSAAAVQARAVLHSNPRVHLPPFQPRRVHRIRKRDFGYLISFRLGRRNCRCRPKTAKARDPAHSAAFVNLRVALSHKSIRRLMSSPPPAADFPAATTTRGRTSAVERQRGALERPPWAQTRPTGFGRSWPKAEWPLWSMQRSKAAIAFDRRRGCWRPNVAVRGRLAGWLVSIQSGPLRWNSA